jgi:hypothetical protein
MRLTSRLPLPTLLLVLLAGCASQKALDQPRTDRSIITREQFLETHTSNAYDAVQALHSNWLITKGVDSFQTRDPADADRPHTAGPSQVLVYLDNTMLGGVDKLKEIALTSISYIRYIDGRAATARWGLDHGNGVIYVSTHSPTIDPPASANH